MAEFIPIKNAKQLCKWIKKYNNPKNLTLMKIQHQFAKEKGYKNWADFKKENEQHTF